MHIKSDSVSALILVLNMRTTGHGTGIIAREIALDIAQNVYRPNVVEHIPGVSNISADALSRLCVPGKPETVPACFSQIEKSSIGLDASLFRTIGMESTV